jgi:hypothetical protein
VNLHLFFQGKMSREEVASAFLATVLEQHRPFRQAFLAELAIDAGEEDPEEAWKVLVEKHHVDITLRSTDQSQRWVVLIENKIQQGAVKHGQLAGYYDKALKRARPETRLVVVYLAPTKRMGAQECGGVQERVTERGRQESDRVCAITWPALLELAQRTVPDTDPHREFVVAGFQEVLAAIEHAATEKYPLVGARQKIADVMTAVLAQLRKNFPERGHQLSSWRGRDCHLIETIHSNVTLYLSAEFEAASVKPYPPEGVENDDGTMTLRRRTAFRLSDAARKDLAVRTLCAPLTDPSSKQIPELGEHTHERGGWFVHNKEVRGTKEGLVADFVAAGTKLLRWLAPFERAP